MVAASSTQLISVTLRVWRQAGPDKAGRFAEYHAKNCNPNMSFLEMLDVLNNDLIFDIGFHTGLDSEFYLRKGFRVVGVEARPA